MSEVDFKAYQRAEIERTYRHRVYMETSMWFTERLFGVPYGPALCEVDPPKIRGIR